MIRILFLGDVVGEPGRRAVGGGVSLLKGREKVDLVIANSENAAGGNGVTPEIVKDLLKSVDVLTSGNHAWDKKEGVPIYDLETKLLRPANYPKTKYYHTPGKGSLVVETLKGRVGILNLMGRVFLESLDCPFQTADRELEIMSHQTRTIFVDFHAETTSEKKAMGFFLNGRVSAVVGTHTHVQTADEQILSEGTAYITDAGMTGPQDSIIGMDKAKILERFLTKRPAKYDVASQDIRLQGVLVDIDEVSGRAFAIRRVDHKL